MKSFLKLATVQIRNIFSLPTSLLPLALPPLQCSQVQQNVLYIC
jgi:hypothetical protein